jgi:endonuclease-8
MPEGDTIAWAAARIRPVLEGRVPDEVRTPHPRHRMDHWPQRLAGRAVTGVLTYGKHLFLAFDGDLVIHSHLRMTGAWAVYDSGGRWGRSPRRAWLVLRCGGRDVVQFDGPVLELLTERRAALPPARHPGSPSGLPPARHPASPDRAAPESSGWATAASSGWFDQRLAALGPDILAPEFDSGRFLRRLRADDPTRGVGDALLDQRTVAGIGNIWKAEGCWEAGVDPWREVRAVSDVEVLEIIELVRPRMLRSAQLGPRAIQPRVYGLVGRPCPRCGVAIRSGGQGDENRTTYWCPGCQT